MGGKEMAKGKQERNIVCDTNDEMVLTFVRNEKDEIYLGEECNWGASVVYQCNEFTQNALDKMIVDIVVTAKLKQRTISSMRWYPGYNPRTDLGYGNYSITLRSGYTKNGEMYLTIAYRNHQENTVNKYSMIGANRISDFLEFLGYDVKL